MITESSFFYEAEAKLQLFKDAGNKGGLTEASSLRHYALGQSQPQRQTSQNIATKDMT